MAPESKSEQRRTTISKEAFLEGLVEHGVISHTCKALKIGRTTAYQWMKDSPEFEEKVNEALRKGLMDRLYEGTRNNVNPATLIFMGKAVLGLSDNAGEAKRLRTQLQQTTRELEALRLAVFEATKAEPKLQQIIFAAVDGVEAQPSAS